MSVWKLHCSSLGKHLNNHFQSTVRRWWWCTPKKQVIPLQFIEKKNNNKILIWKIDNYDIKIRKRLIDFYIQQENADKYAAFLCLIDWSLIASSGRWIHNSAFAHVAGGKGKRRQHDTGTPEECLQHIIQVLKVTTVGVKIWVSLPQINKFALLNWLIWGRNSLICYYHKTVARKACIRPWPHTTGGNLIQPEERVSISIRE